MADHVTRAPGAEEGPRPKLYGIIARNIIYGIDRNSSVSALDAPGKPHAPMSSDLSEAAAKTTASTAYPFRSRHEMMFFINGPGQPIPDMPPGSPRSTLSHNLQQPTFFGRSWNKADSG